MLNIQNLTVSYSHLQVLWDVSLEVKKGEIVTLIGSNGSGKTTLVSSVMGFVPASSGTITFADTPITGLPTYEIVHHHLNLVPETRKLFGKMTVRENLMLGSYMNHKDFDIEYIYSLFPILQERQDQYAGTLSGGEQQMLAIGRCLMSGPEMIILDEPSLGLSPKYVHTVLDTINALNKEGLTILLVEQNVKRALEISHRAYIIENGRIVLSGPADKMLHDPHVKEAYLGM
ncbi:amino acid/amide ABC transporter ATP-binding protein 2, HAAT family [Methanospirillum hungatei JF-1]|uniref:Amino acid/amide ABC transporter ATP-binding protein 2, HAAT family n=1 Tax=Methanospirillum hungatei JF-1 (strain ATCC 27890 / DSM 864 / NBRC 100397 / JF-1) TaxID=323259 RepID=Q2FMU1_METHJ|nr:ABC transporter ATP-binding protein [Methanospirillum hungatei]ABD40099.1 amino acid/amide ABC transporter ATP-binding protein 2, HAAT family [Methanospirillum hungatei JF-1]